MIARLVEAVGDPATAHVLLAYGLAAVAIALEAAWLWHRRPRDPGDGR